MRIQIVIAAFLGIAVEMITALKRGKDWKNSGVQCVDIDNKASSNANSMAIHSGFLGNANSVAVGSATNYNCVDQNMNNKRCHDDDYCHDPFPI